MREHGVDTSLVLNDDVVALPLQNVALRRTWRRPDCVHIDDPVDGRDDNARGRDKYLLAEACEVFRSRLLAEFAGKNRQAVGIEAKYIPRELLGRHSECRPVVLANAMASSD